MDALFQHSKISEMEQLVLMQQHGQNPPEQTETRVGWFYEINHDGYAVCFMKGQNFDFTLRFKINILLGYPVVPC